MSKLKIDEMGRILIKKEIRELLNLQVDSDVDYIIDTNLGQLTIFNREYYDIKKAIEIRLNNKSISQSERNFLLKLLKNNKE